MAGLLGRLAEAERRELLDDLNYLNLQEIRQLCRRYDIPFTILVETADGRVRTTTDTDRKPVILRRIRDYLTTGQAQEATVLSARVVSGDGAPPAPTATDRLYYGWYDKRNAALMRLLAQLTAGRFRNGALARILLMEFWTSGAAPTVAEFAAAWTSATRDQRNLVTPEYAFLTDLQRGEAGAGWRAVRKRKAQAALATLDRLGPAVTSSRGRRAGPR